MRIAIFENIMTPGGHEVEFDRLLTEELESLEEEVSFFVPRDFVFAQDYGVPVTRLEGQVVSYSNVHGIKKIMYAVKREWNRRRLYREIFERGDEYDALIVPTSTYRYLRALDRSVLKESDKPLIFILHGINPTESKNFLEMVDQLSNHRKVCAVVLTLSDSIFGETRKNIRLIPPPTYTARDIENFHSHNKTLTIGFFGQYRREKKLEDFLNVFVSKNFDRSVKLIVQGSTNSPEDLEDFNRISKKFQREDLEFIPRGLIGAEWQKAIASVDALLMPYSAPRYRYHWGGMLFTAIGFQKPVIASDDMNPEVFRDFRIGETFPSGDLIKLGEVLERFINDFDKNSETYESELSRAAEYFSPKRFAQNLVEIIEQVKDL